MFKCTTRVAYILICRLDNLSAHIKKTHGIESWQVIYNRIHVEVIFGELLCLLCFFLFIFDIMYNTLKKRIPVCSFELENIKF